MIPLIDTDTALTTIYLFRLNNVSLNTAFTNTDSEQTLNTLIENNKDNYYMQELTAYRVGDEDFVLNINYNEIIKYNYAVLVVNQDSINNYYFFYITRYGATSRDRSVINLTLDTITTFYSKIKNNGLKGSLERAHIPPMMTHPQNYSEGIYADSQRLVLNPDIMNGEDADESNSYIVRDTQYIEGEARYVVVVCKLAEEISEGYECVPYAGVNKPSQIINYNALCYGRGGTYTGSNYACYVFPNSKNYDGTQETSVGSGYLFIETQDQTANATLGLYTTRVKVNGIISPYTILIFDRKAMDFSEFVKINSGFLEYVEHAFLLPPIYNNYVNDDDEYLGKIRPSLSAYRTETTGSTSSPTYDTPDIADREVNHFASSTYFNPATYIYGYVVKDLNFFRISLRHFDRYVGMRTAGTILYNTLQQIQQGITTLTRSIDNEPILYSYPYKYDLIDLISTTITIKYNDYPIIYGLKDTSYNKLNTITAFPSLITLAIDFYDNSPSAYGDLSCSMYFINYDNIRLSNISISIYEYGHNLFANNYCFAYNSGSADLIEYDFALDKWDTYKNYEKALVDSEITKATIGGITNTILNVATAGLGAYGISSGLGNVSSASDIFWHEDLRRNTGGYYEATGVSEGLGISNPGRFISSGTTALKSIGGAINQMTNLYYAYKNRAMRESAIRRQPPQLQGNARGGSKLQFMFNLTDNDIPKAILYNMGLSDTALSILEQKFYLYGYYTPFNIDFKNDENMFEYIFSSRIFFNYVKFSYVILYAEDLGIPFINDMEERLQKGITFYHINDYYTYDTSLVNRQKKIETIPRLNMEA